jgi:hypothetical protein
MPTVSTASAKATKPRKTTKATAAKATASRTRTTSGATKAKASHAKGARTRARNQAGTTVRQARTAGRETTGVFGDYAERAVLIPVGAALIARDRIVDSVNDTVSTYSSSAKAQAQLRRFERRGATARNRLEREVRKTRVRVERELRQRRRVIEDTVNELDERRESITKSSSDFANRVPDFAREVQDRILNLV